VRQRKPDEIDVWLSGFNHIALTSLDISLGPWKRKRVVGRICKSASRAASAASSDPFEMLAGLYAATVLTAYKIQQLAKVKPVAKPGLK
jgi:hypothetical protein